MATLARPPGEEDRAGGQTVADLRSADRAPVPVWHGPSPNSRVAHPSARPPGGPPLHSAGPARGDD
eukprot:346473-Prorocentrum_minimum.AAC.6